MLALAIVFFGHSVFAQKTSNLLNSYIEIKNTLVNSDGQAASKAIGAFYQTLKDEADFPQKAELLKVTEQLDKAGNDLEKQRAAFNDVSTVMWAFVNDSDKISQPVYYQYCPMKKAYWLSSEKEIKNPYYGASMLACGNVAATKN